MVDVAETSEYGTKDGVLFVIVDMVLSLCSSWLFYVVAGWVLSCGRTKQSDCLD